MERGSKRAARILVVDDEDLILGFLNEVLSEEGYQVTCVSDGGRAVELMGPGKFDLIITDLVMPGLDGVEVLRTSKSLDMDTPVIVITAYPSVDTAERLIDLGAIDYIIKPFNLELIRITVAKVLEIRRIHGAGPQIAWREEAPGFDGLTGAYNAQVFRSMLEAELERSRWRGRECSLLVTRVDKLPSYAAREQVRLLERLVEAVRQESHPGDAAGRTDGPEISVIVAEASTDEAEIIGQRIVAKFEPNAVLAGVACFPGHATSPEDLLSRARAALHTSERPTMSRFSLPGGSIATAPLDPWAEL